ncbi:conserved hypothetical protein [Ricinus communis]|uniref:Uncharacterized protein n=1 Tax=Ricinus communis TaxID=3988 RepID=B9SJZ5_RICCO|nr:conserved hypothetical protein [Ricinus communis]
MTSTSVWPMDSFNRAEVFKASPVSSSIIEVHLLILPQKVFPPSTVKNQGLPPVEKLSDHLYPWRPVSRVVSWIALCLVVLHDFQLLFSLAEKIKQSSMKY